MRFPAIFLLAAIPALLAGCASVSAFNNEPPVAFHDTRMLSAMIAGEDAKLERDFGMKPPPMWTERIVAGVVLPFTVASETVFFPVFAGIKAFAPSRDGRASTQ